MFRLSRQYFAIESLALFVVEMLLISMSAIFAIAIRLHMNLYSVPRLEHFVIKVLLFTGIFIICFYYNELYSGKWQIGLNFFIKLTVSVTIASLSLMVLYYVFPQCKLGRGIFVLAGTFTLLSVSLWRYFYEVYLVKERFKQNVLILGTGERAMELARILEEKRNSGYCLVGFVDGTLRGNTGREALTAERPDISKHGQPVLQAR